MKIKCPYCKREIEIDEKKLQYHKLGRTAKCPRGNCGKKIMFTQQAGNMTRDKNGTLRRKYKPKK